MRYLIVVFGVFYLATSACTQHSSNQEPKISNAEHESEIEKRDSIIALLNSELDSLKSLETNREDFCNNSKNNLYGNIKPEKIDCPEFAMHLNWIDTSINYFNGDYNISITNSCNGRGDRDIEACNCSNNFYISTGSEELPKIFDLFRVGPYREPTNIQFIRKDQILKFNYLNKKDQTQVAIIKINRHSITVMQ